MKIAILADSSCGLKYFPYPNAVNIIPTTISFGEEVFTDGVDITADEFYLKLENTNIIPKTSAPLLGDVVQTLEQLIEQGYTHAIMFTISFELSTYGSSLESRVKELVTGIDFRAVNSKASTTVQGFVCYYAYSLAITNQYDVDTIIDLAMKFRSKFYCNFVVDNLQYLIQNGRLGLISGTIGSLLRIKPLLELSIDGKILPKEKVMTFKKAVLRALEIANQAEENQPYSVFLVLHNNRLEEAKQIASDLTIKYGSKASVYVTTITPTVGAHIGSQIIGIAYAPLSEFDKQVFKDILN